MLLLIRMIRIKRTQVFSFSGGQRGYWKCIIVLDIIFVTFADKQHGEYYEMELAQ